MFRKRNKAALALSMICLLTVQLSAQSFASLQSTWDNLIESANEKLQPYDDVEPLTKPLEFGNIYSHAYDLAANAQASTALQTITATTRDFNTSYSCSLTTDDIVALFLGVDAVRIDLGSQLASIAQTQNLTNRSASFTTACIKATACIQRTNKPNNLLTQKTATLTDDAYSDCRNYALAAYQKTSSIVSNMTSLSTSTIGNDIYYNGTLDDSPYDLLVDIQDIGKIMFENNEQSDSMLFYTFPNGKVAGTQLVPYGNAPSTFSPTSTNNNWTSQNTNSTSTNNASTAGTNAAGATAGPKNLGGSTQVTAQSTSQTANTTQTTTLPSSPAGEIISTETTALTAATDDLQNYACIPGSAILPEVWQTAATSGTTSTTTKTGNNQTTTNGWTSSNWSSTTPTPIVSFNKPYVPAIWASPYDDTLVLHSGDYVLPSTDPINDTSWEAPSDYEAQQGKINSCLDKCQSMWAADKALCSAKCMCGTTYSKNGIFGISICTVPGRQADISRNKSVMSLQEILNELNTVLTALRNSWEMIKHTKTKEFLDTGLRKIKLGKIFNFDLNVTFKPMLDSKPRKKQKAEEQIQTDTLLKGDLWNVAIAEERNKYVTLRDHDAVSARTRDAVDAASFEDNTTAGQQQSSAQKTDKLTADLSAALAKTQNAEVTAIISRFIEENARFRASMHEVLEGIASTSDNIRQKIEKGK